MSQDSSSLSLPEFKDLVKSRIELADFVARNTKLVKGPQGYKACCPLPGHSEKTPSFQVNVQDNYFYCYGCNRGGDIFTYLNLVEGLDFMDALKELADSLGLSLPQKNFSKKQSNSLKQKRSKMDQARDLMSRTAKYFQTYLEKGQDPQVEEARRYLKQRDLNKNQIMSYQLGWSSKYAFKDLLVKINKLGLTALAEELGLIRKSYKGSGHYNFFSDRLMIPIHDRRGKVIAFSGRSLEAVSEKNPKYKNSPENLLFKKKEVLYGLFQAQKLIREKEYVCIVEGFFDQWAFQERGIPSVAVMGTALGEDHLKILGRLTKQVIMVLDNDDAGKRSMLRSLPLLLQDAFQVKIFDALKGKDPDEWLGHYSDKQFQEIESQLLNAREGLLWWSDQLFSQAKRSAWNRLQLMGHLRQPWSWAQSEAHRTLLIMDWGPRLGMSDQNIRASFQDVEFQKTKKLSQKGSSVPQKTIVQNSRQERLSEEIFVMLLRYWNLLVPKKEFEWKALLSLLGGTRPCEILLQVFDFLKESDLFESGFEAFELFVRQWEQGKTEELSSLVSRALVERANRFIGTEKDPDLLRKSFLELQGELKNELKQSRLVLLRKELARTELDADQKARLLQEIQQLYQDIQSPKSL